MNSFPGGKRGLGGLIGDFQPNKAISGIEFIAYLDKIFELKPNRTLGLRLKKNKQNGNGRSLLKNPLPQEVIGNFDPHVSIFDDTADFDKRNQRFIFCL
jgi:hypothetical protein